MIKMYNRARFRKKFQRYRIFFSLMALVFLAALVAELFLYGNLNYHYQWENSSFLVFFSELFSGELFVLIVLFLFGVTLYAPVFGFLCAAARGAFSGFCLSVLFSETVNRKSVLLFILTALYLLLSSWLFLSYASFCTTTALQIYSPPRKSVKAGDKMYGGTLFYASFFQGSLNWRFITSYFLLFLLSVFFFFILVLAFSAVRLLI